MADDRVFRPSDDVTLALVVSTTLSVAGCALVIFTYVRWRRLRRHPASLVVMRSLLDLLLCVEMLANRLYHRSESEGAEVDDCMAFSVLSQFLAVAAELFSLMLSFDLYRSISNPFTNYKSNMRLYHVLTWTVSAVTASMLLVIKEPDGRPIYGRDNVLDICWIRRGASRDSSDLYFYLLFVVPLVLIYLFCTFTLFIAQWRLAQGLPETFELRLTMFRNSMRFVLSYVLYWTAAGAVFSIISLLDDDAPPDALALLLAFAFGGRGIVTLGVWLITYGSAVRISLYGLEITGASTSSVPHAPLAPSSQAPWSVMDVFRHRGGPMSSSAPALISKSAISDLGFFDDDDADLRPHLNHALRKEIMSYATLGIAKGVRRAELSTTTDVSLSGKVAFNRIRLSRQDEQHGLFSLERQKFEASSSKGGEHAAAFASAATVGVSTSTPALSQPLLAESEADVDDAFSGVLLHRLAHVVSSTDLAAAVYSGPAAARDASVQLALGLGGRLNSLNIEASALGPAPATQRGAASAGQSPRGFGLAAKPRARQGTQIVGASSAELPPPGLPLPGAAVLESAESPQPQRRGRRAGAREAQPGSSFCCGPGHGGDAGSVFTFLDFEPHLFARMRELNGISNEDYVRSLRRTRKERFSEGSSGAFLYFSVCDRFIIKTMTKAECDLLMRILDDYVRYMEQHPHSLILRFYGCCSLSMYGSTMYFMVIQNVLMSLGATVHERYDLKGSWVNRHSVPLERGMSAECRYCNERYKVGGRKHGAHQCPARPNQAHEPNQVLRDADWQHKLRLNDDEAKALGDMIVRDTEFLRRHRIMDYSLLLGIHRNKYRLVEPAASAPAALLPSAAAALPNTVAPARPSAASLLPLQATPMLRGATAAMPTLRAPLLTPAQLAAVPGELLPSTPFLLLPSTPFVRAREATMGLRDDEGGALFTEEEDAAVDVPPLPPASPFAPSPITPANAAAGTGIGAAAASSASTSTAASSAILLRLGQDGRARGPITPFFTRHRGGLRAVIVEGPGLYYMGIIDILQAWDWSKWLEHVFKTRVMLQSASGISCVAPDPYAHRFRLRVINQLIERFDHEDWFAEEEDFV